MKNPSRRCVATIGLVVLAALICPLARAAFATEPPAPPPPPPSIIPKPGAPDPKIFTLQDRYLDAARRGDFEMVQLCLEKGVDPRTKDELGRSALALAVRDGRSLIIAETLRMKGLPTDDADAVGRSPLHEAAGNGDAALVSWLLKYSPNLERKDMQGRTPLFSAVLGTHLGVVELLLVAGSDPNTRDNFQDSPLMGACNKGNDDIARLLLEKGADPSLKDQEGRTARERADEKSKFCPTLPDTKPAAAKPATT